MPHEIITDASILDMCLHHCLRPYYQNRCLRNPFERAANIETCRSRLFRGGHLSSEESLPTPGTIFALDKKSA